MTKLANTGKPLTESEILRTVLADDATNPLGELESGNTHIRQGIAASQSVFQTMRRSALRIRDLSIKGDRDAATVEFESVFQPQAMTMVEAMRPMRAEADKAINLLHQTETQLLGPVTKSQRAANELLDRIVQLNREAAVATADASQSQAAMFKTVSLSAAILGVVAAIGLGLLITRGINRRLTHIGNQLSEGAGQVNDAASQVSTASQQLAEGASEQGVVA